MKNMLTLLLNRLSVSIGIVVSVLLLTLTGCSKYTKNLQMGQEFSGELMSEMAIEVLQRGDPSGNELISRMRNIDRVTSNIETRLDVSGWATHMLEDRDPAEWSRKFQRRNFQPGAYRCNLFITEVTALGTKEWATPSGLEPREYTGLNCYTSSQWADPFVRIDNWKHMGYAKDNIIFPGDVVAKYNPGTGYTGHCAIAVDRNALIGVSSREDRVTKGGHGLLSSYDNGCVRRYTGKL